jgi:hypothetical protein
MNPASQTTLNEGNADPPQDLNPRYPEYKAEMQ